MVVSIALATGFGCAPAEAPTAPPSRMQDLLRLVSVLDYVATDYPAAVEDGQVVNAAEYEEQVAFVATARRLLDAAGASGDVAKDRAIRESLSALDAAVRAKSDPARVRSESRAVRRRLLAAYDVVLSPDRAPSADRGRALYGSLCASCHGPVGVPPAEKVAKLRPPPANLRDPERMSEVPPYRVFNTLTFGVDGTSMAAFDSVSETDRWALSFFVAGLPHASRRASSDEVPDDVRTSLHLLATESDRALATRLAHRGVRAAEIPEGIAWLRSEAPYHVAERAPPLAIARRLVDESVEAYAGGRTGRARSLALDAYLEGFEPVEATLRARSPGLVRETERAFAALRVAIDRSEDVDDVRLRGRTVVVFLARAEESGARRQTPSVAFVQSFLVFVREGIEAALVVAALLALLGKLDRPHAKRAVHAGWIAALGAGGLTWLVGREMLRRAGRAEWIEGVVTLVAAAVLFWASYWLLSRAESKKWMAYLRSRVERGAASGALGSVFGISFLAVYREAFETALFYEAALGGGGAPPLAVAGGIACAAVVLVVLITFVMRTAVRLPIQKFFTASGVLLAILCVVFAGHAVHALQGAGALPIRPLGAIRVDALGIYPDAYSLAAQGALVTVYVVSLLWSRSAERSRGAVEAPRPEQT